MITRDVPEYLEANVEEAIKVAIQIFKTEFPVVGTLDQWICTTVLHNRVKQALSFSDWFTINLS